MTGQHPSEPRTAAGRALLAERYGPEPPEGRSPFDSYFELRETILAIEAEAEAQRDRLRDALRKLRYGFDGDWTAFLEEVDELLGLPGAGK